LFLHLVFIVQIAGQQANAILIYLFLWRLLIAMNHRQRE